MPTSIDGESHRVRTNSAMGIGEMEGGTTAFMIGGKGATGRLADSQSAPRAATSRRVADNQFQMIDPRFL